MFCKYKSDDKYLLPKFEIHIDQSMSFTIRLSGWLLPDDHIIYRDFRRTVRYQTLSSFIQLLEGKQICTGMPQLSTKKHVMPKKFDMFAEEHSSLCQDNIMRSEHCILLISEETSSNCRVQEEVEHKKEQKRT